jgi:hypothetical protein
VTTKPVGPLKFTAPDAPDPAIAEAEALSGAPLPEAMGEALAATLRDDFAAYGREAIAKLRHEKPADYLKIIAALAPRHAEDPKAPNSKEGGDPFARLSDTELMDALDAVRGLGPAPGQARKRG